MKELSISFPIRLPEQQKRNILRVLGQLGYTYKWQDLPNQSLTIISEREIAAEDAFGLGMTVSALSNPVTP